MKVLWGIRAEPETETTGLDVAEHGASGYPEFYPRLYELERLERLDRPLEEAA
jgi:hypothetical protein